MGEPQALHDATRRHVLRLEDADDAFEAALGEAELHRGGAGFGGQPAATPGPGQAPSHLDRRKDLGQEMRHGEPRPPDHGAAGPMEQRLDPEAVALVARRHPLQETGGLLLGHAGAQRVPPERLVGVQDGQLVEVTQDERAQDEARRGQGRNAGMVHRSEGPVNPTGARGRQPGRGHDPAGRSLHRAGPAGRSGRHGRPARPPTTSTQTSPVSPLVTCATNSQEAPRSRVPSTWTGSPGCSPAQRFLRRRSATSAAHEPGHR